MTVVEKGAFIEVLSKMQIPLPETGKALVGQATNISDVYDMTRIYREFGRDGKAYIKRLNGKDYIIFKGWPRLRSAFKGTRYLVNNSRVVSFGVGNLGAAKSIRVGTIYTIAFINAWNIADFVLNDKMTLSDLGIQIASDTGKVILGALAGAGAAALIGGGAVLVAPLAVGVVVGIAVGIALDYLDNKFKITEGIKQWANEKIEEYGKASASRATIDAVSAARVQQARRQIPQGWGGLFGIR